jgi:hypothetical protein
MLQTNTKSKNSTTLHTTLQIFFKTLQKYTILQNLHQGGVIILKANIGIGDQCSNQ